MKHQHETGCPLQPECVLTKNRPAEPLRPGGTPTPQRPSSKLPGQAPGTHLANHHLRLGGCRARGRGSPALEEDSRNGAGGRAGPGATAAQSRAEATAELRAEGLQ